MRSAAWVILDLTLFLTVVGLVNALLGRQERIEELEQELQDERSTIVTVVIDRDK